LIQVENFWCVLPNPEFVPLAVEVAQALELLAACYKEKKRKLGFLPRIEFATPLDPLPVDRVTMLHGRVSNASLDPWPAVAGTVLLGLRISPIEAPDEVLAETRVLLRVPVLEPDIPHSFCLPLPIAMLPPASYCVSFYLAVGSSEIPIVTNPLKLVPAMGLSQTLA
jgi:hypothetical protein